MRLIRILVAIACLLAGAVVGALNRDSVSIDFAFVQLGTTLGVALLGALLLGVLLGGLAIMASVALPLRSRLQRMEKEKRQAEKQRTEPVLSSESGDRAGGSD